MDYGLFVNEIKNRISTKELLSFYGIKINSRGFANCPFHHEKTGSLKIYDGDKGYYCFGCGKSGDIVTFMQDFFGLSFKESIEKINDDFSLNLPIGKKISKRKKTEIKRKTFQFQKRMKAEKLELERLEAEYWANHDEWFRLWCNLNDYRPTNIDDELNPLFVEAAQKITYQQYLMECAYNARYEYEKSKQNH